MTTALLTVAGLGLLCAISPCPMAANLATVGFLARKVASPGRVLAAGFAYALGRMATYVLLAAVLVQGIVATPVVSQNLQKYGTRIVGPILILVSIVVLDLLPFRLPSFGSRLDKTQERLANGGLVGAFLLGMVFALAMCPPSAALYFGGMMPLAVEHASSILLPAVFGFATALPVMLAGVLLAYSANGLGRIFDCVAKVERGLRLVTGLAFLAMGLLMTIRLFG